MILAKLFAQQLGNPSWMIANLVGPVWNKRNAPLNDFALASLALNPADRLLEVGFGGGYLLGRMAACGFTEIQTRLASDWPREFVCMTGRKGWQPSKRIDC